MARGPKPEGRPFHVVAARDAQRADDPAERPPADDPEWSDYGRSSRFPPGWWLAGALVIVVIAAIIIF